MKVSKDATNIARRIFRLCQQDGGINEGALRSAIKKVVNDKPRGYRGILHVLQRLVRTEQLSRHVVVESAMELDADTRDNLKAKLIKKHGDKLTFEYAIKPDLLGGVRIKLGDNVWDGTVKSRLERIANAF